MYKYAAEIDVNNKTE